MVKKTKEYWYLLVIVRHAKEVSSNIFTRCSFTTVQPHSPVETWSKQAGCSHFNTSGSLTIHVLNIKKRIVLKSTNPKLLQGLYVRSFSSQNNTKYYLFLQLKPIGYPRSNPIWWYSCTRKPIKVKTGIHLKRKDTCLKNVSEMW